MKLLAGDIGGTNSRLMIYEAPDDPSSFRDDRSIDTHQPIRQRNLKNIEFQSFQDVLRAFLTVPFDVGQVHCCCLAMAGPVSNNRSKFTNREGWTIDGADLERQFHINSVKLINDFEANGYGLISLKPEEFVTVQEGRPKVNGSRGPIALVGAGTGLGECFLTAGHDGIMIAFPTEGGHVDFSPRTTLEHELLSFVQKRLGVKADQRVGETGLLPHVSVERIVSGMGLSNIYEFLREKYPERVDEATDAEYNESSEQGAIIGKKRSKYKLFQQSMEMMFATYGSEVGNVALKYLPYDGLYIAGGIAPKHLELINREDSQFLSRMRNKGRMSSLVSQFPVHVVMIDDLGLRGAHIIASRAAAKVVGNSVV